MAKKHLIATIVILLFGMLVLGPVSAHASADPRVVQLETYLEKVNSPMVTFASQLITTAERYELDWTLLAAIAGTESTFGRRMPGNCINPYGWGIYGDRLMCFASFEEAIEKVGEGLGTKYNKTSLETIARTYNSVSTEAWTSHTRFFMNKIKNTEIPVDKLPITL